MTACTAPWSWPPNKVCFVNPPEVVSCRLEGSPAFPAAVLKRLFGRGGKPSGVDPKIIFEAIFLDIATPVTAEVYVTKILNRDEFRRHCDLHETASAILASLD